MRFLRSLIFYIFFYSWTILYFSTFSTVKIFTRNFAFKIACCWSIVVIKLSKFILAIDYKVHGLENIPNKPFLIASNHQSVWETFFLPIIFKKSIFILKYDLDRIPIFRSYFKKLGFIYVDRNNGYKSMKNILVESKKRLQEGINSIIIFPEGTRLDPDQRAILNSGITALAKNLSLPILPIRHNSGNYWVNKKFIKNSGRINLKIFPIITFNKNRTEVIEKLNKIFYE